VDKELEHFFDTMGPLENKTLALLLQLPPSLQIFTGLERTKCYTAKNVIGDENIIAAIAAIAAIS
jgi:hypothetical protein